MPMTNPEFPGRRPRYSRLIPAIVLLIGVALTLGAWSLVRRELRRSEEARFARMRDRFVGTVTNQIKMVEQALYAGRTLAQAMDPLPQARWADFAGEMEQFSHRKIVGLGFIERVPRADLAVLEARIRADGVPAFNAERLGDNPSAYVVTHLEPRDVNVAALRKDIGSGTTRRTAAEEAVRTGQPVLTRRIQIVEGENLLPGCLLLLPVYRDADLLATPAARTAALRGWVYASIRLDLLMMGVMENAGAGIAVQVFEGVQTTPEAQPFNSAVAEGIADVDWAKLDQDSFIGTVGIPVYGQTWTVRLRALPSSDRLGSN